MEDAILGILRWLHLTATVLWIGLAVSSVLVFNPLARQHIPASAMGNYIADLRKRAAAVVWTAIAIFAVSGFSLMLMSDNFNGFGDYFANSWTIIITLKHAVIGGMVLLALYQLNGVMPKLAAALKSGVPEAKSLAERQKMVVVLTALLGLLVLLLTAIAEVSAT
jgi:uncharacterized membrane protein